MITFSPVLASDVITTIDVESCLLTYTPSLGTLCALMIISWPELTFT